jgi:transposase
MRPKGKPADLEARRLEAIDLLSTGKKPAEVAKLVGASASSVKRWKDALSEGGREALRAKRHPGRRPRMTREQKAQLLAMLAAGPRTEGYPTDAWTSPQVRELIQKHFGIAFHVGYVWQILRDMGWNRPTNGKLRASAAPISMSNEAAGAFESGIA